MAQREGTRRYWKQNERSPFALPASEGREGNGFDVLFKKSDQPKTADPAKGSLTEFQMLFGDPWTG